MKVEPRGGMKNKTNTAGFVNLENFEGATMRISAKLLKESISAVARISEEQDTEYINIGVSTHNPEGMAEMFFIFLDGKKTLAYAVAGATE